MPTPEQLLILNPDNVFILTLTETLGISWWPGYEAEIISGDGKRDIYSDPAIHSDPRKKIIVKEIPIHDPSPEVLDLTWCDAVIFTTMEMIQETPMPMTAYLEKFYPSRRYVFFAGGHDHYPQPRDPRFYIEFKETFSRVVCSNAPYTQTRNKSKLFDVLLGTPKNNRRYIFEQLKEHGLLDDCLISMHPHTLDYQLNFQGPFANFVNETITDYESPELYLLENHAVAEFKQNTTSGTAFCSARYSNSFCLPPSDLTEYYGIQTSPTNIGLTGLELYHVWCSQLIPTQIYDHTWYSIISETHTTGDLISEKTAKGLFARRPFVMFGSQHTLARLQELGFKTFGEVIDESYDNIENPVDRFDAALRSVVKLSQLDPNTVYDKLSEVLDHNYKTITNLPNQLTGLANFIVKNLF